MLQVQGVIIATKSSPERLRNGIFPELKPGEQGHSPRDGTNSSGITGGMDLFKLTETALSPSDLFVKA
jgi:hypothetical protein